MITKLFGDDDHDGDNDDPGNDRDDNFEKCLKEPELTNREEEVTEEDDQDILSKGENLSERENAENESRSVKLGANTENPSTALSQQPSLEQVIIIKYV